MSRLIDADAFEVIAFKDRGGTFSDGVQWILEKIDNMPTIEPQQWIPCSEPPKESGTYIVTAYDGMGKRVTFVKYQKTLKRWDLTGARSYWRILAYKPLPEPYKGENHEK